LTLINKLSLKESPTDPHPQESFYCCLCSSLMWLHITKQLVPSFSIQPIGLIFKC